MLKITIENDKGIVSDFNIIDTRDHPKFPEMANFKVITRYNGNSHSFVVKNHMVAHGELVLTKMVIDSFKRSIKEI